jgi:hypothetical protein
MGSCSGACAGICIETHFCSTVISIRRRTTLAAGASSFVVFLAAAKLQRKNFMLPLPIRRKTAICFGPQLERAGEGRVFNLKINSSKFF